ncbi:putative Ubiquitin-2 like Rad60 SUMO-like/Ubiquitin family [Leishmania naiffi]|uniref:Ubiquitin-2 like Rad60 SUMO-like/Ubiquitin family n=1 Tax=Leishmania naiffi TaxID=5678 RepID=A0AAW3C7F8_9TRYP
MENQGHNNQDPEGPTNNEVPAPVKAEAAAAVSAQQISLKVVNADGAEMFFKIKRGTQLKKLIDAYCKKQGISRGSVRFLFDGAPIDESKTPEDLGMEDDDVIDAMVEQTGGSGVGQR